MEEWALTADWDYAQLTRRAAESGGPEMLMASVKAAAHSDGRAQGTKIGFVAALVSAGALELSRRAYVAWDVRRMERSSAAAAAEREMIQRLKHEAEAASDHEVDDAPSEQGTVTNSTEED